MKQKRYDILLWDVDGTLLNFLESERCALQNAFGAYGIKIDDEINDRYSAINISFWKRLEKREIDKTEVLRGRFVQLFEELMPQGSLGHKKLDAKLLSQIDIDEFRAKYQHELGSVYFYQEDSLTLCKKLKEEGFLQFIITNGVEWTQRNKLQLAGFDKVMEDIYISEVIGYNKPDERFFEGCFKEMQKRGIAIDKSRMLVIGDSLSSDMQGAINAGIDRCHYIEPREAEVTSMDIRHTAEGQNADQQAADQTDTCNSYEIHHLWDVEEILWQNQLTKS